MAPRDGEPAAVSGRGCGDGRDRTANEVQSAPAGGKAAWAATVCPKPDGSSGLTELIAMAGAHPATSQVRRTLATTPQLTTPVKAGVIRDPGSDRLQMDPRPVAETKEADAMVVEAAPAKSLLQDVLIVVGIFVAGLVTFWVMILALGWSWSLGSRFLTWLGHAVG